jgi:hypothetical protein
VSRVYEVSGVEVVKYMRELERGRYRGKLFSIRMPEWLRSDLEKYAEREMVSASDVCRKALSEYLSKRGYDSREVDRGVEGELS